MLQKVTGTFPFQMTVLPVYYARLDDHHHPVSTHFLPPFRRDAVTIGKEFAKLSDCSVGDIVCLLSLTPQAVLEAQMKTSRAAHNSDNSGGTLCTLDRYIRGAKKDPHIFILIDGIPQNKITLRRNLEKELFGF